MTLDESIKASKRACKGCPFNDGWNEEATRLQNYGCLPTAFDMLQRHEDHRQAISCHGNCSVPCRGLAAIRDVSGDEVLSYNDWYEGK